MAYEQNLHPIGVPASADLSADQYRFMVVDNTGRLALAGAGVPAAGVLQSKPLANEEAPIAVIGQVTKLVAGAAFAAGAELMSDAAGKAETATTTNYVNAIALQAAAGAGVIVPALLVGSFKL